ncbi:hypothetical protein SprV_0602117100 [Sparganum proliferum]
MGLLGRMRIHENLRRTTAGCTTPSHLSQPPYAPQISIIHRKHSVATSHASDKCVSPLRLYAAPLLHVWSESESITQTVCSEAVSSPLLVKQPFRIAEHVVSGELTVLALTFGLSDEWPSFSGRVGQTLRGLMGVRTPPLPHPPKPSIPDLPIAAAAAAEAAAENASVENRWCQLRYTAQSTALAVLGRARRQHQDWFDDNDAVIRNLLADKNRPHKAYVDHPTADNKAAFYRGRRHLQQRLREMALHMLLVWPFPSHAGRCSRILLDKRRLVRPI